MRFGDIPPTDDMPPIVDADKNLIMHIALQLLGNHLLMSTDAPESMEFNVHCGNNVHINLQPDTRKETKQLFDALAKGGKVTMGCKIYFVATTMEVALISSVYSGCLIVTRRNKGKDEASW